MLNYWGVVCKVWRALWRCMRGLPLVLAPSAGEGWWGISRPNEFGPTGVGLSLLGVRTGLWVAIYPDMRGEAVRIAPLCPNEFGPTEGGLESAGGPHWFVGRDLS